MCAGVHAHSLVSCMCGSMLELGNLVDQFGWSDLILPISILSNLSSGIATWQQYTFLFLCSYAGIKNDKEVLLLLVDQEDQECR